MHFFYRAVEYDQKLGVCDNSPNLGRYNSLLKPTRWADHRSSSPLHTSNLEHFSADAIFISHGPCRSFFEVVVLSVLYRDEEDGDSQLGVFGAETSWYSSAR